MRKTMALLIFFFTLTLSVYAIDSPYIGKHSGDEFYKYLSITKQVQYEKETAFFKGNVNPQILKQDIYYWQKGKNATFAVLYGDVKKLIYDFGVSEYENDINSYYIKYIYKTLNKWKNSGEITDFKLIGVPDDHFEQLDKDVIRLIGCLNYLIKNSRYYTSSPAYKIISLTFNRPEDYFFENKSPWFMVAYRNFEQIQPMIDKYQNSYFYSKEEKEKYFLDIFNVIETATKHLNDTYFDSFFRFGDIYVQKYHYIYNLMGYEFAMAEGSYYFITDYKKYSQLKGIPKSWEKWLNFLAFDAQNYCEGSFLLSWEENRLAISQLEDFIAKYPNFIQIKKVEELLERYMQYYILPNGEPYNSNFDTEEKTGKYILNPKCKISYENFLKENKKSKYYPLVKEYYLMLETNNFYKPDNINEWFEGKIKL